MMGGVVEKVSRHGLGGHRDTINGARFCRAGLDCIKEEHRGAALPERHQLRPFTAGFPHLHVRQVHPLQMPGNMQTDGVIAAKFVTDTDQQYLSPVQWHL